MEHQDSGASTPVPWLRLGPRHGCGHRLGCPSPPKHLVASALLPFPFAVGHFPYRPYWVRLELVERILEWVTYSSELGPFAVPAPTDGPLSYRRTSW